MLVSVAVTVATLFSPSVGCRRDVHWLRTGSRHHPDQQRQSCPAYPDQTGPDPGHAHDTTGQDATSVSSKITPGRIVGDVEGIGRRKGSGGSGGSRATAVGWRGDSRGATGDTGGDGQAEEQHAGSVDEEVVGGHQQRLLLEATRTDRWRLNIGDHVSGCRCETSWRRAAAHRSSWRHRGHQAR